MKKVYYKPEIEFIDLSCKEQLMSSDSILDPTARYESDEYGINVSIPEGEWS